MVKSTQNRECRPIAIRNVSPQTGENAQIQLGESCFVSDKSYDARMYDQLLKNLISAYEMLNIISVTYLLRNVMSFHFRVASDLTRSYCSGLGIESLLRSTVMFSEGIKLLAE